ncbi:MAG: hypothetical protein WBK10_06670 [Bacillota bacterium]|jgi:hypothetical protein|nr:hypothetical protein [Bacillota bacterium]
MVYLRLATASWLTPVYLLMVAVTAVAVATNVLKQRSLSGQVIGGMVLVPLLLRLLMVK